MLNYIVDPGSNLTLHHRRSEPLLVVEIVRGSVLGFNEFLYCWKARNVRIFMGLGVALGIDQIM